MRSCSSASAFFDSSRLRSLRRPKLDIRMIKRTIPSSSCHLALGRHMQVHFRRNGHVPEVIFLLKLSWNFAREKYAYIPTKASTIFVPYHPLNDVSDLHKVNLSPAINL